MVSPAASTTPPIGPGGGRSRFNPATHYSPHFSRVEILRPLPGEPNDPTTAAEMELAHLCTTLLEECRGVLGVPMVPTSGYRGPQRERRIQEQNKMIAPGAPLRSSQHLLGQACDFVTPTLPLWQAFEALFAVPAIGWDQLLFESRVREDGSRSFWIHVSCAPATRSPRRMALITKDGGRTWTPYREGMARALMETA